MLQQERSYYPALALPIRQLGELFNRFRAGDIDFVAIAEMLKSTRTALAAEPNIPNHARARLTERVNDIEFIMADLRDDPELIRIPVLTLSVLLRDCSQTPPDIRT